MNATIDFATADDLESMADLLAELFTLESDFKPERRKQIAGLRLILENPDIGRLVVVRIDGRVAGMANALFTVSTAEGCRVVLLDTLFAPPYDYPNSHAGLLCDKRMQWLDRQQETAGGHVRQA